LVQKYFDWIWLESMNSIALYAMRDEMTKIAVQSSEQLMRDYEASKYGGEPKTLNREALMEGLKTTGMIAGGVGLGIGAGHLINRFLDKQPHKKLRAVANVALPVLGAASMSAILQMREAEKQRKLHEAWERGHQRKMNEALAREGKI
jgi:hypothetical protein